MQTCTELTKIKLIGTDSNDATVVVIAQHCPKLEKLRIHDNPITITSLLALSEKGLPLEELIIPCIPYIPTADMAKRCSHALSRIRYLRTGNSHCGGQDTTVVLPYLTGLTRLRLNCSRQFSIPLLTHHCHKLTKIEVTDYEYTIHDILSLCHANPLLQVLDYSVGVINDAALMELIHACPHLHTLYFPDETTITDIGILALSEHCTQLQLLHIYRCQQITVVAVLQLLQRCRKLTRLVVSSSSLSEETWTQLDKNTQKRVIRW